MLDIAVNFCQKYLTILFVSLQRRQLGKFGSIVIAVISAAQRNAVCEAVQRDVSQKSGKTFVEQLTKIRMKKARTLLKNGNMTVENIAASVGYPNVEHFNRTFKKLFDMTPIQYRNS